MDTDFFFRPDMVFVKVGNHALARDNVGACGFPARLCRDKVSFVLFRGEYNGIARCFSDDVFFGVGKGPLDFGIRIGAVVKRRGERDAIWAFVLFQQLILIVRFYRYAFDIGVIDGDFEFRRVAVVVGCGDGDGRRGFTDGFYPRFPKDFNLRFVRRGQSELVGAPVAERYVVRFADFQRYLAFGQRKLPFRVQKSLYKTASAKRGAKKRDNRGNQRYFQKSFVFHNKYILY